MKENNDMEYLFKLKKDGETVGYLKISRICMLLGSIDGLEWRYITSQNPAGDLQLSNDKWIHFYDTAHPFVTKDKNGKDVFAGDKVSFLLYRCHDKEDGIIKWQQESHRYAFYFDSGKDGPWGFTDKDIIELIEDKENESDDGS